jgi:hypothetical protein
MKTLLTISTLVFTVVFSSTSFAGWTKVDKNMNGNTWYVDFETIRKHDGYVYWWELGDYVPSNSYKKGRSSDPLKTFYKKHPYLTLWIVTTILGLILKVINHG